MSKNEEYNPHFFSNKEIGQQLNNAASFVWKSVGLKHVDENRKRSLRSYLAAILDVILEHRKSGHMTAEELVAIFTSAALFCHVNLVVGGGLGKLQAYADLASALADDQELLSKPKKKGKK